MDRTPVFYTFDLETCFAPQRRTLFRHRNLQKWSDRDVFLVFFCKCASRHKQRALFGHRNLQKWSDREVLSTFLFTNVLRATTACTFSTSQLLNMLRCWCALYILTWKRASRHNRVQFLMSHLVRWLRTHRFSEVTFGPSGATNHWKNAVNRDFSIFSRAPASSFFSLCLLSSPL